MTIFSVAVTALHVGLAFALNAAFNWAFHTDGYAFVAGYFIVLAHEHYKLLEKVSKMVIIDPEKLNSLIQQEKIKALKPSSGDKV